jgi:hypothetical protein
MINVKAFCVFNKFDSDLDETEEEFGIHTCMHSPKRIHWLLVSPMSNKLLRNKDEQASEFGMRGQTLE